MEAQRLLHSQAERGERVAEGLRMISRVVPPWWCEGGPNEIDPDTLDMSDPLRTLLAQRFGSVEAGLAQMGLTKDDGVACGFIAVDAEDAIQLGRLWLVNLYSSRVEARSFLPPGDRITRMAGGPAAHWYL